MNYVMQAKIDRDVFITGFHDKPEAVYAIFELCKHYNIPESFIENSFSYATNGPQNKKRGVLIITFKDKSGQLKFREQKQNLGSLMLKQLVQQKVPENENVAIRFYNRLTPVNQRIQRELRLLLNNGNITQIKYKNCFFQFKKDQCSAFIPATSMEFLHEYFELPEVTSY
jgi:hypothetical protein